MGSTEDKLKGAANEVSGKFKQGVAELVGDRGLQAEGEAQQLKGKRQKSVGKAKDSVKKAADL